MYILMEIGQPFTGETVRGCLFYVRVKGSTNFVVGENV